MFKEFVVSTKNPESPPTPAVDSNDEMKRNLLSAAKSHIGVFVVSAEAIQNALSDAKNGATQKATELLDFAGRLPYTQVTPEHLIQVAKQAATAGKPKDALYAIKRSISLDIHRGDNEEHLDTETIIYNRTHHLLKNIKNHASVYLVYINSHITSNRMNIPQENNDFHEELENQISELEHEEKSGPIRAIYELPGKGFGEIHASSQYILELLGAIGDTELINRFQNSIYSRIPGIKPNKKDK